MRVLVVDDEPLARLRAQRLLADLPAVAETLAAENGEQALAICAAEAVDVVLLDIAMPGISGIEVAAKLARREPAPAVVFATAYDEHAVAAFEARAVAYLLKPLQRAKLAQVFKDLKRLNQAQLSSLDGMNYQPPQQQLRVRTAQGVSLLPLSVVRYFHADQKYVSAVHPGGSVLLDESLRELEQSFADQLLRVHRNALIALAHLRGIEHCGGGDYRAVLQDIEQGPLISRRHLPALRALLAGSL